jgi:hypothetical protein
MVARPLNCGVRRHVKFVTLVWGERVVIDEVEVHVSANGNGRAAIARRRDGLFCVYLHWKWPTATLPAFGVKPDADYGEDWRADKTPVELLYQDREPEPGIYGTLDDARREVSTLLALWEAER